MWSREYGLKNEPQSCDSLPVSPPCLKADWTQAKAVSSPCQNPRSNQRCIFSLHLVRYQWFPSRFTDPRLLQSNPRRCCWIIIQPRFCGWIVFPEVCTVAKAQLGVFLKIYTQNLNITSNYKTVCSNWALGLDHARFIHVHLEHPKTVQNLTWSITIASQVLITCSHQIPPAPRWNLCAAAGGGHTKGCTARRSDGAAITVRREWPPQLNTDCGKVGVSILEQKETRIYCQQEPPQLCRGGGGVSLSIHPFFCQRFFCSQGHRSARAHPGCLLGKAGLHHGRIYSRQRPHPPTVHLEVPISMQCRSLHCGSWRGWREATQTQKQQKGWQC